MKNDFIKKKFVIHTINKTNYKSITWRLLGIKSCGLQLAYALSLRYHKE